MATVSGLGTTYNLPNYTGELFSVAPSDTPFLSLIGGLGNGKRTTSTEFEWQTEDLESTSVNNSKTEGATAPTASEVSRTNVSNVVEICSNHSRRTAAGRALSAGKLPTMPALHCAITSSGPETMNSGWSVAAKVRWSQRDAWA